MQNAASGPPNQPAPPPKSEQEVLTFRAAVRGNGFKPIRVRTSEKRPVPDNWTAGDFAVLRRAPPGERSTGIRCAGLRAVDIDVDDPALVATIKAELERRFGRTIVRDRTGSSRILLVYRAAKGEPGKRSASGAAGRVEVLGKGQQFVADGLHPDGGCYCWESDKGPHNTKHDDVAPVTEEQVTAFLDWAGPHLRPAETGGVTRAPANVVSFPGQPPAASVARASKLNAAAQAGLASESWFDKLPPTHKNDCLRAITQHPGVIELADQSRDGGWLRVLFALADADQRGANRAREFALAWCQTSIRFRGEDGFNRDWASFVQRQGGISVGTLLGEAERVGLDLRPWRAIADAAATTAMASAPPSAIGQSTTVGNSASAQPIPTVASAQKLSAAFGAPAAIGAFFSPVRLAQSDLHAVAWLAQGMLIRGDITVLAGQGGGAKTAFAVHCAVAIAAGRHYVGPFRLDNRPGGLLVAFISAEEDPERISLLVVAAGKVLGLTAGELAAVATNLLLHDARETGWRLGEPPPGSREDIASEAGDRGSVELRAALELHKPDVLILDTLAALFALPNENDNSAVTKLMRRLARALKGADCAGLLLHHTPKMTRETAAGQRGEATLVRGGSAIVNSARVALSITSPAAAEAGQIAMAGFKPDAVRRLEHVKINDAPPMDPDFFVITSEQVRVHGGTDHAVRAVRFIPPPPAGGTGVPDALRNVAMRAIDIGVLDDHGHKVPLSPGGGKANRRDAIQAIGRALMNAKPGLAEAHAMTAARDVLKDLRDRIGCVVDEEVPLPQYKAGGQPNGMKKGRGLTTRWKLAPWAQGQQAAAQPSADAVKATIHATPAPMSPAMATAAAKLSAALRNATISAEPTIASTDGGNVEDV